RRRHTRSDRDWSSDVCSSDLKLLNVDYDPKVLNVCRLHILRRMGQYLVSEDFSDVSNEEISSRCKSFLEQAYQDFVVSSPLDQRSEERRVGKECRSGREGDE